MGGLPGRAQPSDRQHLATAGVLQQQRERRVQRHCGEKEAQHGTGLGKPLVAVDVGHASDQEPRRGDREDGRYGSAEPADLVVGRRRTHLPGPGPAARARAAAFERAAGLEPGAAAAGGCC